MHVKVVWITLLALADRNGRVWASLPGLADAARVSLEQCQEALTILGSPDEWSRTKTDEGRRIREIDGGWELLNYLKYREMRDEEERRFQTRQAVRRHREKKAGVSQSKPRKPMKAQAEAEADPETREEQDPRAVALDIGFGLEAAFGDFWETYPKKAGKKDAWKAFQKVKPSRDLLNQMLDAIEHQSKGKSWRDGYIPLPATWLRGERWNDELDPTRDFYRAKL